MAVTPKKPSRPSRRRKSAAKKKAVKKAASKAPAKKLPGKRRPPIKKAPSKKKAPAKKASAKRPGGKSGAKAAAKKKVAGKRPAKKATPKLAARKGTAKRPVAKKIVGKKPATKLPAPQSARPGKPHRRPGERPAPRPKAARPTANGHRLAGRPATRPSPIEPKTGKKPYSVPRQPVARAAKTALAKPKRTPALDLVSDLVAKAKAAGADAADALMVESAAISLAQRLGKPDKLERAESVDLGLRVLVGKRQAVVSSTDVSPKALAELVERAVAMARSVPEDPYCGLADKSEIARSFPALDICDPVEPSTEAIKENARACEEAALAVAGVTNSEGAEAGWSRSTVTLYGSNGFAGSYSVSRHSVSVSVIAGEGTAMESDYDYATAVYAADLESPAAVGSRAGERAVARLKPRKAATAKVPVIYDPRVANSLVSHLAAAINGNAIARGTSFLKDKLNTRILPRGVMVVDDPHRRRGLRSKPFDGEGLPNRARNIVEDGVLTTWILDLRSARQLGLKSTGHAARGTSAPPAPAATNLYMTPGEISPEELIGGVHQGFYVTHLMGFGINGTTGDYSRGAAGFWIENGKLAYPVSEVTVAGNLLDMYLNLTPANDLEFRYGTDAPTIRVDGMTVAGV